MTAKSTSNQARAINFLPLGAAAVAADLQTKARESFSVMDRMTAAQKADYIGRTLGLDLTTAIQAAHDAAVAGGFKQLEWPAGSAKVSSALKFSPFVSNIARGEVILSTAQAAGTGMHVSTEWGDRTSGLASAVRKQPVFIGPFHFVNTNASTTATGIRFGDTSPATTYSAHQLAFFGLQLVGWANQADYGFGSYDHSYFGCSFDGTGTNQAANALRVPSTSASACANMSYVGCSFVNLGSVLNILKDPMAIDFHFIGSTFGANLSLLVNNSMVQTVIDFTDCHLEINEYAPYASTTMISCNKAVVNITGGTVLINSGGGSYANPVVMAVTNGGRGNVQHVQYQFAEVVTAAYTVDATSVLSVDAVPKYVVGTSTPTSYVAVTVGGTLLHNGVQVETGTFTGTLTGVSGTVTGTVYFRREGNRVYLDVPDLTGTSNAVSKTITGMPARLYPARQKRFLIASSDNGAGHVAGSGTLSTAGVLTLYATVAFGNWSAAGTADLLCGQLSYALD